MVIKVSQVYKVGPKKVASIGEAVAIYLPRKMAFLRGRTVMVTIEVLEEENDG